MNNKSSKDIVPQQQNKIEKVLALFFIKSGFGYIQANQHLNRTFGMTITAPHYNNTMSTVVRKAFRLLENILIKIHKKNQLSMLSYY